MSTSKIIGVQLSNFHSLQKNTWDLILAELFVIAEEIGIQETTRGIWHNLEAMSEAAFVKQHLLCATV